MSFKNLFLEQQVKLIEKLPLQVYNYLVGDEQLLTAQVNGRHQHTMDKIPHGEEWTCSKLPGAQKCFAKHSDYKKMDGWTCKNAICQKNGQDFNLC